MSLYVIPGFRSTIGFGASVSIGPSLPLYHIVIPNTRSDVDDSVNHTTSSKGPDSTRKHSDCQLTNTQMLWNEGLIENNLCAPIPAQSVTYLNPRGFAAAKWTIRQAFRPSCINYYRVSHCADNPISPLASSRKVTFGFPPGVNPLRKTTRLLRFFRQLFITRWFGRLGFSLFLLLFL